MSLAAIADEVICKPKPIETCPQEDCEPWADKRLKWIRWLGHHRPSWSVRSVSEHSAWQHRVAAMYQPRPEQYGNATGFYSFRYQHPKRLYLISAPDTALFQKIILDKVVASELEQRHLAYPENPWFAYYETPELTLDRFLSSLSGRRLTDFCWKGEAVGERGNPPLYYENAGVDPRWIMQDPDTGEVFLDKHGKPMKMLSGGVNNEFFMSPTGNDSNPGTQALPWLTFGRFYNSAATPTAGGGDILTLLSGTHAQTFNPPNTSRNGTAVNTTRVRPIAGGTVIIRHFAHGLHSVPHQYWEIGRTGTVLDLDMSINSIDNSAGWRLREGATNIVFRNCDLHHNGLAHSLSSSSAVAWGPGDVAGQVTAGFLHYIDCKGRDCGRTTAGSNGQAAEGYGMYPSKTDMLIEGCEFARNVGYGFHFNILVGDAPKLGLVFRRSRCHHNLAQTVITGSGFGGANAILSGTNGALVYNSLFYKYHVMNLGGARGGLTLGSQGGAYNTKVFYCDALSHTDSSNNGSTGFKVFAGFGIGQPATPTASSNNKFQNCISFGNNINFLTEANGSINPINTTTPNCAFGINPNFQNANADDYHLTASTPGTILNAGLADASVTTEDYDQAVRQSPPDIGAYEFGSAPPAPPAAPTGVTIQ